MPHCCNALRELHGDSPGSGGTDVRLAATRAHLTVSRSPKSTSSKLVWRLARCVVNPDVTPWIPRLAEPLAGHAPRMV